MKNISLIVSFLGLFSTAAFASGGTLCNLEAEVTKIESFGILDETVNQSHLTGINTFVQVGTFKILSASATSPMWGAGCASYPQMQQIVLKSNDQVSVGQVVKIYSAYVHDRPGQSLQYQIIE